MLLMCIPCAVGQLPKKLEKCLPYPTLAQEIREMQPEPEPARVRAHVIRVVFDSNDGIPADAQEQISTELRSRVLRRYADIAYLTDLANEIAEVTVRGALRDRGYFNAIATSKLTVLQREGEDISVVVTIKATPGPHYLTGDIRFESTDSSYPLAMSPEILRGLIPLQRGEPFSTARVRTGFQNLTLAYARQGYVDATPEPETQIDEERGTVGLVVKIDQQLQYHVGSIEFLGGDSVTREKLSESLPKPGEVFDSTKLNEFFKVNRAILPSDASRNDVSVKRDPKARTVAILFNLWTCPSSSN